MISGANKGGLLAAVLGGVLAVTSITGCSAPADLDEAQSSASSKDLAPQASILSAASPATQSKLGISFWKIYRGKSNLVMTGYDKSGAAVSGLTLAFGADESGSGLITTQINDGSKFTATHSFAKNTLTSNKKTLKSSSQTLVTQAAADAKQMNTVFTARSQTAHSASSQCGADMSAVLSKALQCMSGNQSKASQAACVASAQKAAASATSCKSTGTTSTANSAAEQAAEKAAVAAIEAAEEKAATPASSGGGSSASKSGGGSSSGSKPSSSGQKTDPNANANANAKTDPAKDPNADPTEDPEADPTEDPESDPIDEDPETDPIDDDTSIDDLPDTETDPFEADTFDPNEVDPEADPIGDGDIDADSAFGDDTSPLDADLDTGEPDFGDEGDFGGGDIGDDLGGGDDFGGFDDFGGGDDF